MKKLLSLLLCLMLLCSGATLCVSAATTYVPIDGEFQNVWGVPGTEIYDATDKGVKLEWTAPDCDWGCRVTYCTPVALDGLTITLTDFAMGENETGFVVGFTDGIGQYVDSNGVFFAHANDDGKTTVSARMPLTLEKEEEPFMQGGVTQSPITSGTVTLSFSKNGDTWTYDINGNKYTFADSFVTRMLTNPNKVYICFCTGVNGHDNSVSFNVASIKTEDVTAGTMDTSILLDTQNVSANAYMPTDGEFANVWGAPGVEIYDATEDGIPLAWVSEDGGDWGGRLTYVKSVDLDGLKIVLTDMKMPASSGTMVLGITNELGQWVDAKGLFFYHNGQNNSKEPVYVTGKYGLVYTSQKAPFCEYMPLNKPFDGTVTITFNKLADGDWAYTVNGVSFRIPADQVADELTNTGKVYVGFCTGYANTDLSFNVSNISDKNTEKSDAAEQALADAIARDTARQEAEKQEQEKQEQENNADANADANANNGASNGADWVLPAVIIGVLLAACVVVVILLIKTGKKPEKKEEE